MVVFTPFQTRICLYWWLEPTCQALPLLPKQTLWQEPTGKALHCRNILKNASTVHSQAGHTVLIHSGPDPTWVKVNYPSSIGLGWNVLAVHQIAWCFLQATKYKYIALTCRRSVLATESGAFLVSLFVRPKNLKQVWRVLFVNPLDLTKQPKNATNFCVSKHISWRDADFLNSKTIVTTYYLLLFLFIILKV